MPVASAKSYRPWWSARRSNTYPPPHPPLFTGVHPFHPRSITIRTTHAQGSRTPVIGFDGEAHADASLAWIQADVYVDGLQVMPDTSSPNALKSGATYTDASLTRCVRVAPGLHQLKVVLSTVGTGYAWVDDYTMKVEQRD